MKNHNLVGYHIIALVVACVWGSTFAASKILLNAGLTPAWIMCLRFAIAYVVLLPICHRDMLPRNLRDELLFIALGMTGGSLYFLSENTALELTTSTSTVAMMMAPTPVFIALAMRGVYPSGHRLPARFGWGSLTAMIGVSLVIFNGMFVLDDNPQVIILSLGASLSWVIYSIVLYKMETRYSSVVISRKVFFWGVVTMLPVCFAGDGVPELGVVLQPGVCLTLLYLALVASLWCFYMWNVVCLKLGMVSATNYQYFNPVVSLVTAYAVLDERITPYAIAGCALVICGVWFCNTARHRVSATDKAIS